MYCQLHQEFLRAGLTHAHPVIQQLSAHSQKSNYFLILSEYNSPRHEALVQKTLSLESLKTCSTSSETITPTNRKTKNSTKKLNQIKTDESITASLEQFDNDVFDSITNSLSEFVSEDYDLNKQEQNDKQNCSAQDEFIEHVQSDNESKLNPLKTSRSMTSIGDVDDLLRSSNESFGRLAYKKPVLGAESKVLASLISFVHNT